MAYIFSVTSVVIHPLDEGASTRLLVHAAKLIAGGVNRVVACRSCIAEALTDDAEMLTAVHE